VEYEKVQAEEGKLVEGKEGKKEIKLPKRGKALKDEPTALKNAGVGSKAVKERGLAVVLRERVWKRAKVNKRHGTQKQ